MSHYKSNLRDLEFNLFEYNRTQQFMGHGPFTQMDEASAREILREVEKLASGAIAESFEEGDRYVCRFTMTGTHEGEFMGVSATGREIALPGITILRFEGDRCAERWSNADMLGLLVQLGAVPAPA